MAPLMTMMAAPTADQIAVIAETCRLLGDPIHLRVLLACLDGPIFVGEESACRGVVRLSRGRA